MCLRKIAIFIGLTNGDTKLLPGEARFHVNSAQAANGIRPDEI
jgi:hypothetical protein